MSPHLDPISIARDLSRRDLFYFTPRLLADLFELDLPRVYRLLARLKDAGLIAEVEKAKFLLLGLEPERVLSNPLFIASHLATPGYVSYWSALHFYGFTEQVPQTTFVATTRKKPPVVFRGRHFRFVFVKPARFFGYRRERVGDLPALVADEAKAILDSLEQPRYAGGIGQVARALRTALDGLDVATLVEYANRMANKSLGSRLGYLLERFGRPADGLLRSDSPVKLDATRPRAGPTVSPWRVIVNAAESEFDDRGVG